MTHPIPLAALDSCAAIVGRTGSGKTTAARGAVEALLDEGRQVVVIDPTGAWWGLRLRADGKGPGFPIPVLGGDHGDTPLPPTCGERLARLIVERHMSAVIDTSLMTMGERRRFYVTFLGTLHDANRTPLHLVVDEADELAPQKPLPDQTMVLHHMERIVRRGRVRGFRPLLITQRPAVLNKNVLSQAGLLIAMQLTAAQDRAAIGGWIEGQGDKAEARELLATLPRLSLGEGWIWWPTKGGPHRASFPLARTHDSGRTPETGDAAPVALVGSEDMAWLREAFAEPAAPDGRSAKGKATDHVAETEAMQRLLAEEKERSARLEGQIAAFHLVVVKAAHSFSATIQDALAGLATLSLPAVNMDAPTAVSVRQASAAPAPRRAPAAKAASGTGAHLRILQVLAQRHPAKLTAAQWATLSRMSRKGGTWSTYVSRLRTAGLIEKEGDFFRASPAGLEAAQVVPAEPATAEEVLYQWKGALGSGPAKMLDALRGAGARGLDRDELATACAMAASGGTFSTYLSRLSSNGLIERNGKRITLVEELR